MSDCVIFVTGTTSGAIAGEINISGLAQESSLSYLEQWNCHLSYRDNAATMQAKIKACVALMYLTNFAVVIGGSDKVTIMGGPV